MKVLIVAEQLDIQNYLRQLNPDPGLHFFQYTHPLKAMDNLEELSPDLILWNADDFPRHWKSFVPFFKALFPIQPPQFHLISEQALSLAELGKAEALAVDGIHAGGFFQENMVDIIGKASDLNQQTALSTDRALPHIPSGKGSIQLQHPELRQILVGEIMAGDQKSLRVLFKDPEHRASFTKNMVIENAIFRIADVKHKAIIRYNSMHADGLIDFLILDIL